MLFLSLFFPLLPGLAFPFAFIISPTVSGVYHGKENPGPIQLTSKGSKKCTGQAICTPYLTLKIQFISEKYD